MTDSSNESTPDSAKKDSDNNKPDPASSDVKVEDKKPAITAAKAAASQSAETASGAKKVEQKPAGRGALVLAILSLLLAIAACGAAAWLWLKGAPGQLENTAQIQSVNTALSDDLAPQLATLTTKQTSQAQLGTAQGERLKEIEETVKRQAIAGAELSEVVQGGQLAWRLGEVDHLLRLAHDRVALARDVEGAINAMEVADKRLGLIPEPRLLSVRRQIVADIAALRAVPRPDRTGIALRLSNLIQQVPTLPLRHRVPGSFESPEQAVEVTTGNDEDRWQRALNTLREAWRGLVHIRHTEQRIEPLLPPDQEFFLRQNLTLKLEAAYLALLQNDSAKYQQSMKRAIVWLDQFYDREETVVGAAIDQLSEVAKVELAMPMPDLTGSLEKLREYRAGAAGVTKRKTQAQPAAGNQE